MATYNALRSILEYLTHLLRTLNEDKSYEDAHLTALSEQDFSNLILSLEHTLVQHFSSHDHLCLYQYSGLGPLLMETARKAEIEPAKLTAFFESRLNGPMVLVAGDSLVEFAYDYHHYVVIHDYRLPSGYFYRAHPNFQLDRYEDFPLQRSLEEFILMNPNDPVVYRDLFKFMRPRNKHFEKHLQSLPFVDTRYGETFRPAGSR